MFPEDQHHTQTRLADGPTLYFALYVSGPKLADKFLETKAKRDAKMADPKARRQS